MSRVIACLVVLRIAVVMQAAEQPNILIVLADDLNIDSIGCYGNPDVKTPNLDLLAKQGMRFTHATTT